MKPNHFYLIKRIIEPSGPNELPDFSLFSPEEIRRLLKIASSNRVLFMLCKNIKQNRYLGMKENSSVLIDKIIAAGEEINNQYAVLLKKIKNKFERNNIVFLIVKTDRKNDYILSDVDILLDKKQFQRAQQLLKEIDFHEDIKEKEGRWHYKFNPKVQIDLHLTGLDWYSKNFIDTNSLWSNTQQRQFLGDVYNFPSVQNEWIFNALNIIYEKFSLTYLDLLFFKNNKKINPSEIRQIAKDHGWEAGLQVFNRYLSKLEKQLTPEMKDNAVILPQMFSWLDFFKIFISRFFSPFRNYRSSLYYFCYFIYCKIRFIFTKKSRIPFYGSWFNEI